ncbi:Flp pilus assembly protein TadD [Paraburkholderia bannensis]|uniref:Flp pilus assembly protein TadD n=2 Tax=Paraburkholderia bannensis TaxID=765414 RepID=A0A7W9WRA1_9BURK|nr:tetratricopeptide repeat protein [Paraburkholderia sp. WP4_3_2]MBB6100438.1 Flp pilus assembly protein TadD [Paraburkholderia bannensis]
MNLTQNALPANGAGDLSPPEQLALAERYLAVGRTDEAIAQYERLLSLEPEHPGALHSLALACMRAGRAAEARSHLDRAVRISPANAQLWEHRGLMAALAGELDVAEAAYHRAMALAGSTSTLHRNLADVLKLAGRRDEARHHYERALALDPVLHHAARRLADLGLEAGHYDDAARYLALAFRAGGARFADGLDLLKLLSRLGRQEEATALIALLRAELNTDAHALKEFAFALNQLDHFDLALDVSRQGLSVDPSSALLHHNAAYAAHMRGDFASMHRHNVEAARLAPDDAHIQFNLAVSLLREGAFEAGWKQYAWHERLPENSTLARPPFAEWAGEPVAGKRILMLGEQGLGDQIQLLRCADWLHRAGAVVDVWVDAAIVGVARCASGVRQAFDTLPGGPYDYWCRMFRMPEHMQLGLSDLPVAMPYLRAPKPEVANWRMRLDALSPARCSVLRAGLVWAGNPGYQLDRFRSIKIDTLMPVLAQPGVSWFALQKGAAQRALDTLPAAIDMTALGEQIATFDDTLAIVQSLDLVLTVDTSVAHLAAASGVPVWVLLPACTDWRWMAERADSPWYPSVRLFRQRELGQWGPVLDEVRAALAQRVEEVAANKAAKR